MFYWEIDHVNCKKKRILFLTHGSNTGSEHTLFNLINNLDKTYYEVILLTRYTEYFIHNTVLADFKYSIEGILTNRDIVKKIRDRLFYHKNDCFPFNEYLTNIIKIHKPDLIYVNSLTLPAYFDCLIANKIPVIFHGHSLKNYLDEFPVGLLIKRIKTADLFISVSESQKQAVLMIALPGLIKVLNPAINLKELTPDHEMKIKTRLEHLIPVDAFVWSMASVYFNENKSPVRFIELAYQIIQNDNRPVYFQWIGGNLDDPLCRKAMDLAISLNIDSKIHFTGFVSRSQYLKLLNATDAFLLVSIEESFSIVSAEAIALGKPVLSSDCKGIREFITKFNGVIVPGNAMDQLASAAIEMMQSISYYDSEVMFDSVKHLDISIIGKVWESILSANFGH